MAKDFRTNQVRSHKIIGSGSSVGSKPSLMIYSASSATDFDGSYEGNMLADVGTDTWLFVSGSPSNRVTFGGDVTISGTIRAEKMIVEIDEATTGSLWVSGSLVVSQSATVYEGLVVNESRGVLPGNDFREVASKAKELVQSGFNPVPHFPARSIKNLNELKDYVSMCKDFGVKQALVIGGSSEPIGNFHSSLQLLETGLFQGFKIGIAGHPEGSPDISDSDLEKAMEDKKPFADYIVTQWLLNPDPINKFISKQSLPVHVGITGPLKITSLIKFANIVGAKNSLNFIKSNATKALDLLRPSDPNDLINKIKGSTNNFHIYTFGSLKETNKWLVKNNYA